MEQGVQCGRPGIVSNAGALRVETMTCQKVMPVVARGNQEMTTHTGTRRVWTVQDAKIPMANGAMRKG
jgi:hypothetical protein